MQTKASFLLNAQNTIKDLPKHQNAVKRLEYEVRTRTITTRLGGDEFTDKPFELDPEADRLYVEVRERQLDLAKAWAKLGGYLEARLKG